VSRRLLIVDDEAHLLLTLIANLELEGFEVVGAANGVEALALLKKQPFDLVLSDIRMPGMNGIELFNRVKLAHPTIPVVLMTAFAIEDRVEEAIAGGVFAVLPKPFDIEKAKQVLLNAGRHPEVLVVVEGLSSSATTIAGGLSTVGIPARGVADAKAAVETIRSGPIDVCVTDMGAPQARDESLDALKSADPLLVLIVVAPGDNRALGAAALKATACVRRPLKLRDLIRVITKARGGGAG
jgi:DNA-binding NtrC family response regulator